MKDVPFEDRLQSLEIREAEDSTKIKTLGMLWDAENDVFTFCIQPPDPAIELTERNVLRTIAKIFDPLQFLTVTTGVSTIFVYCNMIEPQVVGDRSANYLKALS